MRISDWSSDVCSSDLRFSRDPASTQIVRHLEKRIEDCLNLHAIHSGKMILYPLRAITGHNGDVTNTIGLKRLDLPFDQRPAIKIDHALGHVRCERQQARSLSGAQADGFAYRHEIGRAHV